MKKTIAIISVILISSIVFAHEYVMLAYKYKVQKGDTLEVHLFVADGFNIQLERPLQKEAIQKFELISKNGTTDLLLHQADQTLPIVNTKVDFDGLGLIHMERDYARISLATKKFKEYIKEDHLENISVGNDAATKMQRERYTRYLKILVQSGKDTTSDLYKKTIGQNFEIVLLQNPYLLHKGNVLQAKILFMGKPLVNKIITARNRIGNENTMVATSRTDAKGICTFKLLRKGEWFIHATHMIPCLDKTDSDWESFWASYSFEIQ